MKKEIPKFNIGRLRGKDVVVNCVTEEQAQNFINWVVSLGEDIDSPYWETHKEDTCYCLHCNLWVFNSKDSFEEQGYEVISYEEALEDNEEDSSIKNTVEELEQKDKKINNLHKMLTKKDIKIENQAKELSVLLKINEELKQGIVRDLNTKNKVNEKINKVSKLYEGQLKVYENKIKRLYTIIHYLEDKSV